MIDFTDISSARVAFKQLYNQVQKIFKWDLGGNRLQNVAAGTNPSDAVNLKQLMDSITVATTPSTPSGSSPVNTTITNLTITNSLNPSVDDIVDIGTTSLRFKKLWAYLADFKTTVVFSGLTASLPLLLDVSKNVISALIDLTANVSGVLPEANGGTGTSTVGINGALTLNVTTQTIHYVDTVTGAQTLTVVTGVTLTSNNFTNGKRTT